MNLFNIKTLSVLIVLSLLAVACPSSPRPEAFMADVDGLSFDISGEVDDPDGVDLDVQDATDTAPDSVDVGEDTTPITMPFCIVSAVTGCSGTLVDTVSLTLPDDLFPDAPGLQVNIEVDVSQIPPYTPIELWLDGTRLSRQIKSTAPQLTFSRVSLTHAPQPDCHEMIVRATGAVVVETSKTVCVDTGLCGASLQPSNGACLLQDADVATEGFQGQFELSNRGTICYAGSLTYGDWTSGPLDLSLGSATTLLTVAAIAEGHSCTEVMVKATVEDATNPERLVSIEVPYRLSNLRPALTFTAPLKKVLNLADDLDNDAANGVQVAVEALIENVGPQDAVVLQLDGQPVTSLTGASGAASFGNVTLTTEGLHTLELVTTDSCCGLETRVSLQVVLLLAEANLALVLPVDGSVLFAAGDDNPTTTRVYETSFLVYAPITQPGQTFTVQCRKDAAGAKIWFTVGTLTIAAQSADFSYAVPVLLDTSKFGNSIECWVRDSTPFYTPISRFRVAIPGPVLKILSPVDASAHTGEALPIVVEARNLEGRPFGLTITGPAGVFTSEEVALGSTGLQLFRDLSGAEDGDYTLTFEGTDQWGNNPADLPSNVTSVGFSIDNGKPRVEFVDPPSGTVCTVDTCPDADPAAPGYQVNLGLRVLDELHPERSTVCLTGDNIAETCATPDAEGNVLVEGISIVSGLNQLTGVVTDAAGWVSEPVPYEVTLDLDAPQIKVLTPAPTSYVLTPSVEVQLRVTNPKTAAVYNDATVAIRLNGLEVASATAGAAGLYVFSIPGLTADSFNNLQAFATHPNHAYEGVSGLKRVYYKTTRPVVHWVSPAGSSTINLASAECAPGSASCKINLTAGVDNAEDGATAELALSCVTLSDAAKKAKIKAGLAVWTVTLPSAGQCTLKATVVDLAGQVAVSVEITLAIDRVAPVVYGFVTPFGELLPALLDEDQVAAGYQLTPEINVGGLEKDQLLTLTITKLDNQVTETVTVPVASDVVDGKSLRVSFGRQTFQEGVYTLEVSASDKAGNTASLGRVVQFYLTNILIKIDSPSFAEKKVCANDSECGGGTLCQNTGTVLECVRPVTKAGVPIRVLSVPGELFLGDNNLRVCSDAPGLRGRPLCQSAFGSSEMYVVETKNHAGGADVVTFPNPASLEGFPQGLHHVVLEVKRNDTGEWVSTMNAPAVSQQERWFWVDTLPPAISSAGFPGDTLPPVGMLNVLEQAAVGARFDLAVTGTDLADGQLDIWLNGVQFPAVGLEADAFTTQLQLYQNLNSLSLVAQDNFGNRSTAFALEVTVDTVPPALAFFRPTSSPLAVGSSPDVIVSATGGDGNPVLLSRNVDGVSTQLGSQVPGADKSVTFAGVLAADGVYKLLAETSDLAGNSTSRGTSPEFILVDRTPPQVQITAPADLAVVVDANDASTNPGFQVGLDFTLQGATSYKIFVARCSDITYTGCAADALAREGLTASEEGQSLSEALTITALSSTNEFRIIKVTAADGAGNTASALVRINIRLNDCIINISGLPDSGWVNAAACLNPVQGCGNAVLPLGVNFSAACGDADAFELLKDGVSLGVAGLADTIGVPLNNGVNAEVELLLWLGGAASGQTSGAVSISVDLTPPVLSWVTPAVDKTSCNASEDLNQDAAGLQANFTVHVEGDNLLLQPLHLDYNSGSGDNLLGTLNIDALPFDGSFADVTLPEGKAVVLQATVSDKAGNTVTLQRSLNIDVTRPSPVELKPIVEETDINRRRPAVLLTWNAVGDDGVGGSAAISYDIRYARSPITEESFATACTAQGIGADNTPPMPGVPGALESFELSGPDLRARDDACIFQPLLTPGQRYYFAVKATDDAGNTSLLGAERYTEALALRYAKVQATGLNSTGASAFPFEIGDFDGDGLGDLVVGLFSPASGICLMLGREAIPEVLELKTDALSSCVVDPWAAQVGTVLAALGDINGDGLADFGVRVPRNPDNTRAALIRIYLGNESGVLPAKPDLQIRYANQAWLASAFSVGRAGNFNGDFNGVRPVGDLIVGAYEVGKAFIIPGSPSWVAGADLMIDLSLAGDLEAWKVATIQLAGVALTERFGYGVGPAGDVLQDPGEAYDDVIVARSVIPNTSAYIVAGRPLTEGVTITLSSAVDGSQPDDADAVRLLPDVGLENNTHFCADSFGGVDFSDDGRPDVGCVHVQAAGYNKRAVYLFDGAAIAAARGGSLRVAGAVALSSDTMKGAGGMVITGSFTNVKRLGNFDDTPSDVSPSLDLVYGDYNGGTKFGSVYLRFNRAAQGQSSPFPSLSLQIKDPYNPTSTTFGGQKLAPLGDFNGDGYPDLSVGVDLGGTYQVLVY